MLSMIDNAFLVDYYNLSISIPELLEKHNITYWTYNKLINQPGFIKRRKNTATNFSEETLLQIVEEYKAGVHPKEIKKNYSMSLASIARLIKKHGLEYSSVLKRQEKHIKLVELYNEGKSIRHICETLKMDGRDVTKILEKNNIEVRPVEFYSREHYFDFDYFEKIDSHTKAQILGMLWTDGSVDRERYITISLHHEDEYYLKHMLNAIGAHTTPITDVPIYELKCVNKKYPGKRYMSTGSKAFCLCSKKMVSDLGKLGVIANKTYKDCEFPNIDPKFYGAWVLGALEGDGWVTFTPNRKCGRTTLTVGLLLQNKSAHFVHHYMTYNLGIDAKIKKLDGYNNELYRITIHRYEHIVKLYHWLYDNAQFVMHRKHDKFVKALTHIKNIKYNKYDIGILNEFPKQ